MFLTGGPPKKPAIKYFRNYPDMFSLVSSRLDPNNILTKKKMSLKLSKVYGINATAAGNIDDALSKLKIDVGMSIKGELGKEQKQTLEYIIEFPE